MSPAENDFNDSSSLLNSENAVHELVQQPLLDGIDDHLFEFSEALRSVSFVVLNNLKLCCNLDQAHILIQNI